ncbi:energy transducer TonB [Marinoscillum sp. MHG1-6]|uniref:energy transducer TonB n=1 Tax=Marinoscillum sp. MHG1-6 TaxID=2959627 RepID=UPI00280B1550|nr:energy transducer TonB [Marinoscillum sp. MHG1-6]
MFAIDQTTKSKVPLTCEPLDDKAHKQLHGNSYADKEQAQVIGELISLKYERSEQQEQLRRLFFVIGLIISLLSLILLFEWKTYDSGDLVDLGDIEADFDEIVEIPPTEQPPPPPPSKKLIAPVIQEVPDEVIIEEVEIELDVEVTQDEIIRDVKYNLDLQADPPAEEAEEIFDIVESRPEPVGGMKAFYEYVQNNLKYPATARRLGLSGRVYVQFVVEKDGSITDVKVIKGFYDACDQEAVRVIQGAPKWKPGAQRGRPVRVYQRLPIVFKLQEL